MIKSITNKYASWVTEAKHGIHENVWNAYEVEKAKMLKPLFGDKYIIEKEINYHKAPTIVADELREAGYDDLFEQALDSTIAFIATGSFIEIQNKYGSKADEEWGDIMKFRSVIGDFNSIGMAYNPTFPRKEVVVHPITKKKIVFNEGTKKTKALKHFVSDQDKLNQLQTKYSQIMNNTKISGTLCLSIHPMDYLTVSDNDCDWTSCFSIKEQGIYCASTTALLISPNTVVAYLKSKTPYQIAPDVEWNSKRWRAYLNFTDDLETIHIGRNYPYDSEEIQNAIAELAGELTNREYTRRNGGYSDSPSIHTPHNMYNDGVYSFFSTHPLEEVKQSFIYVSQRGTMCLNCGDYFDNLSFDTCCENCIECNHCAHCDAPTRPDGEDSSYVESIHAYVCEGCLDSFDYCNCCSEYYPPEHCVEVIRYNGNTHSSYPYWTEYECKDCVEYKIRERDYYEYKGVVFHTSTTLEQAEDYFK